MFFHRVEENESPESFRCPGRVYKWTLAAKLLKTAQVSNEIRESSIGLSNSIRFVHKRGRLLESRRLYTAVYRMDNVTRV